MPTLVRELSETIKTALPLRSSEGLPLGQLAGGAFLVTSGSVEVRLNQAAGMLASIDHGDEASVLEDMCRLSAIEQRDVGEYLRRSFFSLQTIHGRLQAALDFVSVTNFALIEAWGREQSPRVRAASNGARARLDVGRTSWFADLRNQKVAPLP